MSFLNEMENLAGEQGVDTKAKVAGGLMQALDEHPGGLAGVLDKFRSNGMADLVKKWSSGEQQTATPEQVQQGLSGSGLIDSVAAKAGVSPDVAKKVLAAILPVVISHFTSGGKTRPPQSGFSGMASHVLGKLL